MSKIKEVIRIRVIEIDEEKKTEKIELLLRGDNEVLTTLVYSAMMSNQKFCDVVFAAANEYATKRMEDEIKARLN
jgi:hypothetical protein